jgi:hypothetical protein
MKTNDFICRVFSIFMKKEKKTYGYYAIMYEIPNGFAYKSADFHVTNFNPSKFMNELYAFIKQKENLERFTIVTLVIFPNK